MCRFLALAGMVSPFISMARPVYHSSCSADCSMSPFIFEMVLPVSITSVLRRSSPRSRMRLAICLRYFPRSLISSAAQAGCAFSAAGWSAETTASLPGRQVPPFPVFLDLTHETCRKRHVFKVAGLLLTTRQRPTEEVHCHSRAGWTFWLFVHEHEHGRCYGIRLGF